MKNWGQVRPVVVEVLKQQRFTNSGNHYGKPCFLSTYQIAVLVDNRDSTLKGNLPIGGEGEGIVSNNQSFAQQIAWHISDDINNKNADDIEMRFFSKAGLDAFTFRGKEPSANEFTMFCIKE